MCPECYNSGIGRGERPYCDCKWGTEKMKTDVAKWRLRAEELEEVVEELEDTIDFYRSQVRRGTTY